VSMMRLFARLPSHFGLQYVPRAQPRANRWIVGTTRGVPATLTSATLASQTPMAAAKTGER